MSTLSLMQGTVGLLILRSLQKGPAHGYAITRWVHERTDGVLAVEDAALYQALHRLEAKGWVEAEWGGLREQPPREVLRPYGGGP